MNVKVKDMTLIAVMTAVICIISPWSIPLPITTVSITLGSMGVLLASSILGAKKGTISVLVYILLGFVGLPIFSQFRGGPSVIAGPTGGYIVGYIFMAIIVGIFADKCREKIWLLIIGMVLGTLVLYAFGTIWYAFYAGLSFNAALSGAVIPFIPLDLIKILTSAVLCKVISPKLGFIINREYTH